MDREEIEKLIDTKVEERLKKERIKLAQRVQNELLYSGQYAKCYNIMKIFNELANE